MIRHLAWPLIVLGLTVSAHGQQIKLLKQAHDPYGIPRPGADQKNVPLRTSFYIELGLDKAEKADFVPSESVSIRLQRAGGEAFDVLIPGRQFGPGYSGRFIPRNDPQGGQAVGVYATSDVPLEPSTAYTIEVSAKSQKGVVLSAKAGKWSFTTEAVPLVHELSAAIDLKTPPVRWQGAFFSGFCKPSFCTSDPVMIDTYELMKEVHERHPKAWRLQRDFWMTGMDDKPGILAQRLPNVVRERETRRITAIEEKPDGLLLKVEDFFGHEQYGIPSGRPVSADYHPGDEVLIADGEHDARVKVLATDDQASTVLVSRADVPPGGWRLAYSAPLPANEDPKAPGLFAWGGCYLRKFNPSGTPCYYWGRLDKEWDIAHKRFGHRLMPNIADAPGDLSIDGRNWTTAKDYVQLHEVVRTMTDHVIARYGDACLDFVWSVFNEPDLGRLFWRSDWNELQRFYDYSTDAILRAFEDRGYDSNRVFIGGLELGGIFGTNLKVREFLTHCSPRAEGKGALPVNAAFADPRLDGKRSKRVEALCRPNGGKGAPCDFVSIHAYNRSDVMAAKLIRAKEIALQINPEYYQKLWVNSHESCPGWSPPADPAAADSYLDNGYFSTWCADVARRQLQAAARDPRYAFGETILTFWMGPNQNFSCLNNCTRLISVDDDGDGRTDRKVLVPMQIFNFLSLLAGMSDDYRVLPEQTLGGHVVSGMATQNESDVRILLYAHDPQDTQSRSDRAFKISLDLAGIPWETVRVDEYRFDRKHNSYYDLGRQLRDRPHLPRGVTATSPVALDEAIRVLESGEREAVIAALKGLAAMGPAARPTIQAIFKLAGKTKDESVRSAATEALLKIGDAAVCHSAQEVNQIQTLATLRATGTSTHSVDRNGKLKLTADVQGNGANFVIISPEPPANRPRHGHSR